MATSLRPPKAPSSARAATVANEGTQSNSKWLKFHDMLVHKSLFRRGILAFALDNIQKAKGVDESKDTFTIRNRTFRARYNKAIPGAARSVAELLPIKPQDTGLYFQPDEHQSEAFLPFKFANGQGMYAFPWITKSAQPTPKVSELQKIHFDTFQVPFCMFSSALMGTDNFGNQLLFMKHDKVFMPGQIIQSINYQSEKAHPYRDILFYDFEHRVLAFIKETSSNERAELQCHLPTLDYMLFALKLYIRNRITHDTFNSLLDVILIESDVYKRRIRTLCENKNIDVTVSCPYEDLFKQPMSATSAGSVLFDLLNQARSKLRPTDRKSGQPAENEFDPAQLNDDQRTLLEKELVNVCLEELKKNTNNEKFATVWKDFSQAEENGLILIEQLLALGNAVMVGAASAGKGNLQTCVVSPISEKQIPVKYQDMSMKTNSDSAQTYPQTFNMTYIDPAVAYSSESEIGMAYYCGQWPASSAKLPTNNFLMFANKNVGSFKTKDQPDQKTTKLRQAMSSAG